MKGNPNGRIKQKQRPIRTAINTYMGNYCFRKCFKHDEIILDCKAKFDKLERSMWDTPITFKELNTMIKSWDIKICRLPPEKRRLYVPWKDFERLAYGGRDFWDWISETNSNGSGPQQTRDSGLETE